MYVEKIEIPAFRVLRDVVLEFDRGYDPQIFPIGSENGGGKSTLLQLVFALLHCSAEPSRIPYLKHLLESDTYAGSDAERLIARLTVRLDDEPHAFEFISLHDCFLSQRLEAPPQRGFETHPALVKGRRAESRRKNVVVERFSSRSPVSDPDASTLEALEADFERITGLLTSLDYRFVTTYKCPTDAAEETHALACRVRGLGASKTGELLSAAASKVFLLGPSNQQYLFLGKRARKALLKAIPLRPKNVNKETTVQRPQIQYLTTLDEAENVMTGFYAYDWLSVDPLVQLFAAARDEDFKGVVETGSYGGNYSILVQEVNGLLVGKTVRPLSDLSGVEFIVTDEQGRETPLSPEDLSQGELKRLMIYAWLKANKAEDSLVLIDEIEASLHPDWQLGIVHDLQDWAPNNQYLLATHSYDLCRALTPRHVRDLSPALPWKGAPAKTETKADDPSDG